MIVLKNGKNVYPEEIEQLITNLPYVEEVMVFGEPRTPGDERDLALCAKIVYKAEYMKSEFGLTVEGDDTEQDQAVRDQIQKIVRRDMEEINGKLPVYKKILRLVITDQPMIKTTTGKMKRFQEMQRSGGTV